MLYIIADANQKIVEKVNWDSEVSIPKYLDAVATNQKSTPDKFSIVALNKEETEKINSGAEWEPIFVDGKIAGVDFSAFDSKGYIVFDSDSGEIESDGGSSCVITAQLTDSAGNTIDASIGLINIPVQSPMVRVTKKVSIENGFAKFEFRTTTPGMWKFPADGVKMISNFRVANNITIDALLG